jgi:hypothetical protein
MGSPPPGPAARPSLRGRPVGSASPVHRVGYYFGVLVKPWFITVAIMGAVAVWFFLLRAIWRTNLLDRLLGLNQVE